jgi:ParB-like chromosome segregation protein Spo0J
MATAVSFTQESGTMPISLVAASKLPTTLKQVGQRRDFQMIDPRLIDIEPGFNARDYTLPENRAHLDRLKVLIARDGIQQPITVRLNRETGRATVVNGECRLRAVLELIAEGHEILSMADMPCYPAPAGSDDPIRRRFASLNANEGKPFSMWELGRGYQDLFDQNVSLQKIAEGTANTVAFVKEAMELSNAPDEVKQLLSSQAVTPAEVKRILRSDDVPAAVSELQAAVQAKQAKGEKGPVKRAKAKTLPPAKPQTANDPAPAARTKPAPKSQTALCPEVMKALVDLMSDVALNELNDDSVKRITVDKELLLKLASFMVTEEEAKHILAGDVAF